MAQSMRERIILDKVKDRKVLHVGCCDTPSCRYLAHKGILLHMKIHKAAGELWGLDICEEDVKYLTDKHKLPNIVCGDAERMTDYFGQETFDIIVAGEVIEHLANPGLFLTGAYQVLKSKGTLIVTVPNGLAFRRGLKSLLGKETVHPDHNYWFSRKTITRLLSSQGFVVTDVFGLRLPYTGFLGAYLADLFSSLFSEYACEGVMAIAIKRQPGN